jgi:uncharacterized caspase-like protein
MARALRCFSYAGHGLQVSGQNYLVPVDAKLVRSGDLSFETINVNRCWRRMEAGAAGQSDVP